MKGAKRVVVFCLLTAVLPTILIIIPIYLRNHVFADVSFTVSESDVLEIGDDISTIFCQKHILQMNHSFNAYQVDAKPEIGNTRKHIRLKKSMRLPDDTLEYWGFFLPNGSTVKLSLCSRFDGSKILVVRGERNLRTCGLLDHTKRKEGIPLPTSTKSPWRERFELKVYEDPPPSFPANILEVTTKKTSTTPSDDEDNIAAEKTDDDVEFDNVNTPSVAPVADAIINSPVERKLRHSKRFITQTNVPKRFIRSLPVLPHNLDGKVVHGGNAGNRIESEESSASSFETELFSCYGGSILLTQGFAPSQQCHNVSYLLSNHTGRLTTTHNVNQDGYYYYIFYSDNDLVENDLHAVFDIYKPSYQLANITKQCVNQTSCTFSVGLFKNEMVIVEIPTRDGIENEDDDFSVLMSVCEPRMAVYIIFPMLVLLLIIVCAFL